MTELKGVSWMKQLDAHVAGDESMGVLRVAKVVFDPSANTGQRPIGAYAVGSFLPAYAIIVGGFMDVNTAFTTGASGTLAVSVEGANDIQTATIVSSAPWSTIGRKAIVPKANTPESTSVKVGATQKQITFTVATGALTAGRVTVYLYWLEGTASA